MQEYAQLPAFCRSQMSLAALNAALTRLRGLSSATANGAGLSLQVFALLKQVCYCRGIACSAAALKSDLLTSSMILSLAAYRKAAE